MVILWTNLEGDKVEPSPTRTDDVGPDPRGVRPAMGLKRRVQVALKPSLPSLFLPLVKPGSPTPTTDSPGDSVSLPSSIDSCDQDETRLVTIRSGDLSPDSGVLVQYDSPSPSSPEPVNKREKEATNRPEKTLPIVYGTRAREEISRSTIPSRSVGDRNRFFQLSGCRHRSALPSSKQLISLL